MARTVVQTHIDELLRGLPIRDLPVMRRAVPIARKRALTAAEFTRDHLDGAGLPLVVEDAQAHWPARTKWTFDYFRHHYGEDEIIANLPMFLEPDLGLEPVQARMRLADYLDYIRDPRQAPRAQYTVGDLAALRRNRLPLYAPIYRVLHLHPELTDDVGGSRLYFMDDLFARLPAAVRRFLDRAGSPIHYLFFAPRDSVSFLHTDYWSSHAYLAQLAGRKLCVLFAPADDENVYHGAVRNPLAVDAARFPRFAAATPYVAILEAGDTAVIPSGWWHFVVGLSPSLTYSYNFFTTHNMNAYLSGLVAFLLDAAARPAGGDADAARALNALRADVATAG
ncbi:MAG: cupin-like domain-containing protein [Gammaproteobacteria bacterium]